MSIIVTARRAALAAVLAGPLLPLAARAQGPTPDRPVRIVVPFPPGGPVDTLGRLIAERLAARWGRPVIVENRPGGSGGVVGTQHVARSAPDGTTLGMVISAHTINPAIQRDLPYDTLRDLAPVTLIARAQVVLVAHPDFPARSLEEVIELSRRSPDGIPTASPGVGTLMNMTGHLLAAQAGARLSDVPYQGSAPALTDVLAGRVPLMLDIWHSVRAHVEAGRLRVIAAAGPTPIQGAEHIPLMSATVPGFAVVSPMGLVAPGATPSAIRERIADDIRAALQEQETRARMQALGLEAVGSTPAEYGAFIESEIARWQAVVRDRGIRVQ
ncbi:MAG: tripartite tricarboxylate transporter substrate binding protein [Acetobacteraceae bacterium]|nr:tripartite tricarboxylate transporter substrate binding protein [Acetobacteraceae bacterium]